MCRQVSACVYSVSWCVCWYYIVFGCVSIDPWEKCILTGQFLHCCYFQVACQNLDTQYHCHSGVVGFGKLERSWIFPGTKSNFLETKVSIVKKINTRGSCQRKMFRRLWVCESVCVYICVCVCVRERSVMVCVCVCVCERESERDRVCQCIRRRVCVCVCSCICMCVCVFINRTPKIHVWRRTFMQAHTSSTLLKKHDWQRIFSP